MIVSKGLKQYPKIDKSCYDTYMETLDYALIDKSFLQEGESLPFKLYRVDKDHDSFYPVLFRNKAITPLEWKQWRKVDLYIEKKDEEAYENYAVTHMTSATTKNFKTFTAKSKLILQKAETIMREIFSHPDASTNLPQIKTIINDLILTVLDEEFSVTTLDELTTHDYNIHTHSINVTIYALSLGKHLKLSNLELHQLGIAALIHDLGKSKIRADIVNKHGRLSSYEMEHMKRHPQYSYDIAKKMGIGNEKILYAIKHHRENIDGSGYPDHIKAGQISLFARIIAICDSFDALTSKRSYKEPVSTFDTLKMMKQKMNHQLDERLLNNFVMMMHS